MSASIEPGDAVEPDAMPTYVWEPTTDFLAAKYGLPRESIVRFDVNTSPLPPDLRDVLTGPFDPVLSEYPPSDYAALVDAAAAAYGVGTDESGSRAYPAKRASAWTSLLWPRRPELRSSSGCANRTTQREPRSRRSASPSSWTS